MALTKIANVIAEIKRSRQPPADCQRCWNVVDIEKMDYSTVSLLFQFYVSEGELSLPALPAAARIFSWVCRSTSPATRCSRCMVAQVVGSESRATSSYLPLARYACLSHANHVEQRNCSSLAEPASVLPRMKIGTAAGVEKTSTISSLRILNVLR